jgi:hypothetical protein
MKMSLCLLFCGAAGMAAAAAIPFAAPVSFQIVYPLERLPGIAAPVCAPLGTAAFAPPPPRIPANPAQRPAQARLPAYGAMPAGRQTVFLPPAQGRLGVAASAAGPAVGADYTALGVGADLVLAGGDWMALAGGAPVTAGAGGTRPPVAHGAGTPAVDPFIGCESAEPWAYSVAGMYANLARAAKARGDEEAYVKLVNQYLQMVEQGELRKTMTPRRR